MQSRRSPPLARSDDPTAALWLPLRKLFGAPGILVQRFGLDEERSRVASVSKAAAWLILAGRRGVAKGPGHG